MKSPNTSTQNSPRQPFKDQPRDPRINLERGMTLMETLIVIGLISFVAVIGVIVGIDTYQRYVFRSDLDKAASLLQKARSSSLNNVAEKSHGVKFDVTGDLVLFRAPYSPADASNYKVGKSKAVVYSDNCPNHEVVFNQLTGATSECKITITEGSKTAEIEINREGRINF